MSQSYRHHLSLMILVEQFDEREQSKYDTLPQTAAVNARK